VERSEERASAFSALRCAEVTPAHGYRYMATINVRDIRGYKRDAAMGRNKHLIATGDRTGDH
jgi:hypothetical protein